jgi:sporulation protein YlmC with PRC-barrel domain
MDLVQDVLDKQIVDKNGVRMGRVDGLVAEMREGQLPRLVFIETGTVVMARRFGARAQRLMTALLVRLGAARKTTPYRIAWKDVREVGVDIELDVD